MSEQIESPLSEKQLARVEAIKAARDALQAATPISRGSVDPIDLVSVARYIETGEDPWEPHHEDDERTIVINTTADTIPEMVASMQKIARANGIEL